MWSTIRDKHRITIKKGGNIAESHPRKLKVPVGTRWVQLSDLQAERLLQLIEDEIDAQVQIERNEPLERWKAGSDELKRRYLKLLQNEPIPNFYVSDSREQVLSDSDDAKGQQFSINVSWSKSSHKPDKELEPQLKENKVQSEELSNAIAGFEDITLDKSTDEESNGSNSNGRADGGPNGTEGMGEDREDIDNESVDKESNSSDSNGRAGEGPDSAEGMGEDGEDIDSNENEVFIPMNNNFKKVLKILEAQHMTRSKRGE
ncbi:hypothetical protein BDZ91DRAFT_769037 [Kalaharituber pfeilii]|nr:hypothetical protein BDZ91DRAFT_769037 [Kalaharituber pfeilii]